MSPTPDFVERHNTDQRLDTPVSPVSTTTDRVVNTERASGTPANVLISEYGALVDALRALTEIGEDLFLERDQLRRQPSEWLLLIAARDMTGQMLCIPSEIRWLTEPHLRQMVPPGQTLGEVIVEPQKGGWARFLITRHPLPGDQVQVADLSELVEPPLHTNGVNAPGTQISTEPPRQEESTAAAAAAYAWRPALVTQATRRSGLVDDNAQLSHWAAINDRVVTVDLTVVWSDGTSRIVRDCFGKGQRLWRSLAHVS